MLAIAEARVYGPRAGTASGWDGVEEVAIIWPSSLAMRPEPLSTTNLYVQSHSWIVDE